MEFAKHHVLFAIQHRMQEAQQCGHMLTGRMDNALLGDCENDQRRQVEHERCVRAGGQFVQQSVLVAQDQSSWRN